MKNTYLELLSIFDTHNINQTVSFQHRWQSTTKTTLKPWRWKYEAFLGHSPTCSWIQKDPQSITHYILHTANAIWSNNYVIFLGAKSRCLLEAGQASGYEELPFPSSAGSVYPPWCTPFANLQEDQISLAQPVSFTRL